MTGSLVPMHPGLAGGPVDLDCNATTPVDPRVAEAMVPHRTDSFSNPSRNHPSRNHPFSNKPRRALAEAHGQVAALIGARADEVVFTASGSEADGLALRRGPRLRPYAPARDHAGHRAPGRPGDQLRRDACTWRA
ncbi:aminotransferase class V-fold PLP-dependent enzyme [Streptomyces sp. AS02]|uniref:aminotransferase class V-fold PLP-dependent enzyme n=1 Tax=Streptomyces sp. AS02 TaxID=2938946 RepID=UPI002022564F|nr:aminotransferase class V-fold PLP-dependent enzyme [Streptomyces sp. AS02]MCL8011366.1 aminotransferase class V-fold PLP-dependent enzyme [Streptomyces sp. AS02]